MKDCMADLETLGVRPSSIVLSIGAVFFDRHAIAQEGFYAILDQKAQVKAGRTTDPKTLEWWKEQSEEARAILTAKTRKVPEVLKEFTEFLKDPDVRIWGNGSDFDNVILKSLFESFEIPVPWDFWNNRCFRTLKSEMVAKLPGRQGTHHNALHDAIFQAKWAIALRNGEINKWA